MTRADKFEEIFGYRPATDQVLCNEYDYCGESDACNYCMQFRDEDWWNAEYKEPTTKNNLGVDCISRADAIQAMQDKAKKITNEDTINGLCGAVAILFDMPSVTPQEPFINKPCVSSGVCEHDKNNVLDKIDEIITDALDKSTDQKESQTLRWVLDKISEVENGDDD